MSGGLTDIPGVRVGHATDAARMTGCTVVLLEDGAAAGIDLRGQATGTRQIDSLSPTHLVQEIQAIYLTGGSAFGLDSAAGVMSYLEERGKGAPVMVGTVPIVPTAVVFDLALGDHAARPDPAMARSACEAATGDRIEEGSVGAGTGTSVGKMLGVAQAMKGGVGTASIAFEDGTIVAALAVVNAFGDIVDPDSGKVIAGARWPEGDGFVGMADALASGNVSPPTAKPGPENTVLVVVGTNAALSKPDCSRLAAMSQSGMARAIRPVGTIYDGDAIFAFSMGTRDANLQALGAAGAEVVTRAIVRAIQEADGRGHLPAWRDRSS